MPAASGQFKVFRAVHRSQDKDIKTISDRLGITYNMYRRSLLNLRGHRMCPITMVRVWFGRIDSVLMLEARSSGRRVFDKSQEARVHEWERDAAFSPLRGRLVDLRICCAVGCARRRASGNSALYPTRWTKV
jgi:hypothetical protein